MDDEARHAKREAALRRREAAERPRETADRMGAVATGTVGLTSLVTVALFGAAGVAGGQDVVQEGGGEAAAAGTGCPEEQEGASNTTQTLPAACTDPDQGEPGGTQPSPEPEAQADTASEPGLQPTEPPSEDGLGEEDGGEESEDTQGGDETGVAGPGGRDGRARGGRVNDHRGAGNGTGGTSDRADRHSQAPGPVVVQANPAPSISDFAPTGISVSSVDLDEFRIPSFLVPIYQRCGDRYGIPWEVLAAINRVETAFGSNLNVSSAGAVGWMQFMPTTWKAYGVDANHDGRRNPYDPKDAICAAAHYLDASGGRDDLRRAIFAYNHADWYVDLVIGYARQYARLYLPDPLPKAHRLDKDFARSLAAISRGHQVDWAKVLAILRARGNDGKSPAPPAKVRAVAESLSRAKKGGSLRGLVAQLSRGPEVDLQVPALTRYNRAVGLPGLVKGLHAVGRRLARRVLESERIEVYDGGREDIAAGRIDVRVLTLLLYLSERYDPVTVSSLKTGHGYYARPGVPSLHSFGQAVDIAALNDLPILGNQEPGGITEQALRDILLLPEELQPSELISLFDLGGSSFAAADHDDHIHAGF